MSEFKGTKGKWEVKHSESKDAFNVVGTVIGSRYKIARIPYLVTANLIDINKIYKAESEANAKLIACAPEMLEMLENVVSWYGKRDFKTNELYSSNFQEPLIKEVIQLIKKATEL